MRKLILIFGLLLSLNLLAQDKLSDSAVDYEEEQVEMADQFRAEGKIYVVVAIIATVLAGLIIYAVVIDRKITKVEKELEKEKELEV